MISRIYAQFSQIDYEGILDVKNRGKLILFCKLNIYINSIIIIVL